MTPWERARRLFPVTAATTWLDHAGGGPISSRVDEAVRAASEAALLGSGVAEDAEEAADRLRPRVAQLAGAPAAGLELVPHAQAGLARLASRIDWRPGDCVALLGPCAEAPWHAARARGVELLRFPVLPPETVPSALEAVLSHPRTRLLVAPAVDPDQGTRTPLAQIGRACRERAVLFCIDASHALGCLAFELDALAADYLVADGHRFLLSLPGCGLLLRRTVLAPLPAPPHPGPAPALGAAALGAAVDLLLELGPAAIERRVLDFDAQVRSGLTALRCEVAGEGVSAASGTVCFRLGEEPPERTRARLRARGFRVGATPYGVRVSPHFYNEPREIEALLDAL